MRPDKKKEKDCYAVFLSEMVLIQTAEGALQKLLSSCRSSALPNAPSCSVLLIKEGAALHQNLLQYALTSFVTPMERKDIVRLSNALFALLSALSDAACTLPRHTSKALTVKLPEYGVLLHDCCAQLFLLLQTLAEKKRPSFPLPKTVLSHTALLQQTAASGKSRSLDCLEALPREAVDFRQLSAYALWHRSFSAVFDRFTDCARILEEILCSG